MRNFQTCRILGCFVPVVDFYVVTLGATKGYGQALKSNQRAREPHLRYQSPIARFSQKDDRGNWTGFDVDFFTRAGDQGNAG